jgi:hypothetical protein
MLLEQFSLQAVATSELAIIISSTISNNDLYALKMSLVVVVLLVTICIQLRSVAQYGISIRCK